MRRLSTLLIPLTFLAVQTSAQNVTFSLTTPPCASNGVLQATSTLPGTVTYSFYGAGHMATIATNTTGTLTGYNGEVIYVNATNGINNDYGTYNGAPPFNYQVTTTSAACPAQPGASVSITGGTAPYTIQWFPSGSSTAAGTGSPVTLPNGSYDILITDAAGCQSGSFVKNDSIYLQQTTSINFSVTSTAASCTNGTATASAPTGGTAPYTYLWSNNATTNSIGSLVRGSYSVKVTDAQGCSRTNYVYVNQTPLIPVNVVPTAATCANANGAAMAFGSGGMPPYTYLWSNAQTTSSITGIPGNTSLTVTAVDANGCVGNGYAYISTTSPVQATYSTTPSSCTAPTGTATLSVSGGVAPYTINWGTFPAQTGLTASGLASGTYNFTVTDVNGCQRTGTVFIAANTTLSASVSTTSATCNSNNGAASVTATGGVTPYAYMWSTSSTGSSLNGIAAGTYSVSVTDAAGCRVTKSGTVQRFSPVNIGLSITPASCEFTANGAASVTATGGTTPYSFAWSGNSSTGSSATGLLQGNYAVTVTDAAGCTASSYFPVGYNAANSSCYCTITGTVYNDANHNCTLDAGEAGIPNVQVHCSGRGYSYTNSAGVYSFRVPTGSYTLSQSVQAYYPLAPCQSNSVTVNTTAGTGCVNTVNFADTVVSIHDLNVFTVSPAGPPIPGFQYYQRLVVRNDGTLSEIPTVGYKYDNQLGAPVSTSIFYTSAGGNRYRNNSSFPSMTAGAVQQSTFQYNVPTNIPINTGLVYYDSAVSALPMTTWVNDYTPWNNVSTYNSAVMGAFDPNSKEVSPAGKGPQGNITNKDSVLTYTIHFQNEGNWPASKVVLIDTLDPDFIITSLKPLAGSHAFKTTITDGTPSIVKFTFDPIYLPPDAEDHIGSMGYVVYSIRQKPGLPIGTKLENSASIYFDFNAPIKTNTALSTIAEPEPTSVPRVVAGTFDMSVYPNPASNSVKVKIDATPDMQVANIRIVNLLGQSLLQQQVRLRAGENIFEANTSSLATGLYFVEVTDGVKAATQKLSIAR